MESRKFPTPSSGEQGGEATQVEMIRSYNIEFISADIDSKPVKLDELDDLDFFPIRCL